jgi:hypothetical protein
LSTWSRRNLWTTTNQFVKLISAPTLCAIAVRKGGSGKQIVYDARGVVPVAHHLDRDRVRALAAEVDLAHVGTEGRRGAREEHDRHARARHRDREGGHGRRLHGRRRQHHAVQRQQVLGGVHARVTGALVTPVSLSSSPVTSSSVAAPTAAERSPPRGTSTRPRSSTPRGSRSAARHTACTPAGPRRP